MPLTSDSVVVETTVVPATLFRTRMRFDLLIETVASTFPDEVCSRSRSTLLDPWLVTWTWMFAVGLAVAEENVPTR